MATAASRAEAASGPQRTCVGCRQVRDQAELIRIVRTDVGTLAIGRTLPGRGAWLCRGSSQCLDQAKRRGGFRRSFRVPISTGAVEELRSSLGFDQRS